MCVLNASFPLLAFEQLIEDLTQEKFSLQRALDTSRSIAETLAADHASITENYNQQVSPLKCFFDFAVFMSTPIELINVTCLTKCAKCPLLESNLICFK